MTGTRPPDDTPGGRQLQGGPAPLAAVIGSPVAHSLSPIIHRAAFEHGGLDWSYAAFDVTAGAADRALDAMRVLGIAGLSVTMPHKEQVADSVDVLDGAAAALRSVNTVGWDGDRLKGWSTDGDGFVAALAAEGVEVAERRVVVLGAGGAGRSVIVALGRAGAADIAVLNRTPPRAEQASGLAAAARIGRVDDLARAGLVVNATSVGMGVPVGAAGAEDLPCDVTDVAHDAVVADLVYHPLETAWMSAARSRGHRVVDGLGMLVHQAALQQQIWTGRVPDVGVMRAAAEQELCRRAGRATTPSSR